MDHFNLNISLDYIDEDFDFGSKLSSTSSARSFSSAGSCAPITPRSGRSTPQQHVTSTSLSLVTEYNCTPSERSMGDYLPSDTKAEIPTCDPFPSIPTRKASPSPYNMNIEHATLMNTTVPAYGDIIDFTTLQAMEDYSFSDHMSSSPFNAPPPPYSLYNGSCDSNTLWPYQPENSLEYLSNDQPSLTLSLRNMALPERSTLPSPYHPINTRRQLPIESAQHKSAILHRIQNGGKVTKRGRYGSTLGPNIGQIKPGTHKCQMPECVGKKGYKRSEHLKRHMESVHNPDANTVQCEYCGHNFNRKDNWKQHLLLHTKSARSATARTNYFPEAVAKYEEEMLKTKRRNTMKKRSQSKK
ncbi:C2H2 finger domain-containing protein [Seiridium cupressi]